MNLTLKTSENGLLDHWKIPGNVVNCCSLNCGNAGLWEGGATEVLLDQKSGFLT